MSELLQRTALIKQHRIVFKETAQLRLCRFFILDFNACPYRVPPIFTGAQDCGSNRTVPSSKVTADTQVLSTRTSSMDCPRCLTRSLINFVSAVSRLQASTAFSSRFPRSTVFYVNTILQNKLGLRNGT